MNHHRTRSPHWLGRVSTAALIVALAACGGNGDVDAPGTEAANSGTSGEEVGEYDPQLVEAAQQEGALTVYSGAHTREHAELATQLFQEEFGISATISRQPSGAVRQQVEAELAAGALEADVIGLNDETTLAEWGEDGLTVDAEIPNRSEILTVLDDGAAPHIPYTFTPLGVIYNTTELDDSDIPDTWAELPSMELPFVHSDPRASGVALGFTWSMMDLVGEGFYEDLAAREVLASESGTAVGQMVATGEVALAIPGPEVLLGPLVEEGEPVAIKYLDEGIPAIPSFLAQVADSPNPNAAQLFVQWHAGSSFQQALIDIGGRSVVEGAAAPGDVPELDSDNLLVPPDEEVNAQRDELGQVFERILD